MQDITVLILAGGNADRFWPLKDKLFIDFLGKPLLFYRLEQLKRFGFSKIIIVGNEQNESTFHEFSQKFPQFFFDFYKQKDKRGMAGAVLTVADKIKEKQLVILKPMDIFEDILLDQFKKALQKNPDYLLTGFASPSYFPGGYITVENGFVRHITEKPKEGEEPSNMVRLVFDYFKNSSAFIASLKGAKTDKDDLYEVALEDLIKKGEKLSLIKYDGYWGYLQYPWHILSISSYFLSNMKKKVGSGVDVARGAVIKGNVFLDDGVKVLEGAKILGPAFIGKNTVIGNTVMIRESMIGQNCVLGFATEVTRSYIGNNSWFHTNYIGDSVIADNVGMGSGAVLANFRLDEATVHSKVGNEKINTHRQKLGAVIGANTRIGVNSSIMPGIKTGESCMIGSGVLLDRDMPDGKACFAKSEMIIVNNKYSLKAKSRDNLKLMLKV